MEASLSSPRAQRVSFLSSISVFVVVVVLPCLLSSSTFAVAADGSSLPPSPKRLASATSPPLLSIPPLPRAEELCSLAKQYAVPLKLCSDENNGNLEIDRGSLLAAVAAVGAMPPQLVRSKKQPEAANSANTADAANAAVPPATMPPQSLDSLRQQLDQATIQAASYLAPPLLGSPEAAALAAAEKNATTTSAREKDFASPRARGGLVGAAVSVAVVSVALVVLA